MNAEKELLLALLIEKYATPKSVKSALSNLAPAELDRLRSRIQETI